MPVGYATIIGPPGANKKNLKGDILIHQYYTISGTICVKVEDNGAPKSITHMVDLEQLLPEINNGIL